MNHRNESIEELVISIPPCKQVVWDPCDLIRMQRLLDKQDHPSTLRRKCLKLASRLWIPANSCFFMRRILDKESDCIPYENTIIGKLRNILAEAIAPVAAPQPEMFWSFLLKNVELLRNGATIHWLSKIPSSVYFNGDKIEDTGIVNEWRLFRYQIVRLPVNTEPANQVSGPYEIQLASVHLAVMYKKDESGEVFTFEECGE